MSMALGALKDRMVMPDYSLVPWRAPTASRCRSPRQRRTSPGPTSPTRWPRTAARSTTSPTRPTGAPIGVQKQSLVSGLYLTGLSAPGYYAAAGHRPDRRPDRLAERRSRRASPTAPTPRTILDEITDAPLLLLHRPLDRAGADADVERLHRRPVPGRRDDPLSTTGRRPSTRTPTWRSSSATSATRAAQNKADVTSALRDREDAWFDYYVKGEGAEPQQGVEAYTRDLPDRRPPAAPTRPTAGRRSRRARSASATTATKTIAADSTTRRGQFNPVT